MTNYSRMSDFDINRLVARARDGLHGDDRAAIDCYLSTPGSSAVSVPDGDIGWIRYDYCNSWADSGPIIEENTIQLSSDGYEWFAVDFFERFHTNHENPLRAACIVFLMMKESEKEKGNG